MIDDQDTGPKMHRWQSEEQEDQQAESTIKLKRKCEEVIIE
jgi:hypothetical protein